MTQAKLFILGQEIELLWTDMNYYRKIDELGLNWKKYYGVQTPHRVNRIDLFESRIHFLRNFFILNQ